MKRVYALIIPFMIILFSCGEASTENKETTEYEETTTDSEGDNEKMDPSSGVSNEAYRNEQIKLLVASARETIDSIDVAYKTIFNSSRQMQLSLDEREQVNVALQELSNTKDLIVLETQKAVVDQLKEKTNSLKTVLLEITTTSDRLGSIVLALEKVSSIIEKTTNTLADALSFGIVKPKISVE